MGPGAGLDRCGKSRPTGIRSPDLPSRIESIVDTNTKLDTNTIVVSVTKLTPKFPTMHHTGYAGDRKDADAKCNM